MRRAFLATIVIAILAAGVTLGVYIALRQYGREAPAPPRRPGTVLRKAPTEVKVYRVVVENNKPLLKATVQKVKPGDNPVETALRALLQQAGDADLANPIPEGTRLLGVKITDGLAEVNLSREFKENFGGGSMAEALIVDVILQTLRQFSEVKQVQLLVEGDVLDTLGHADLSEPLDVRWVSPEFVPKTE